MTGKKQNEQQEEFRDLDVPEQSDIQGEAERPGAARPIMIRALSILAVMAALAVAAAPVASAGTSKKPPPRGTTSALYVANHTEGSVSVVGDRRKLRRLAPRPSESSSVRAPGLSVGSVRAPGLSVGSA